jgi:predicted metalloprotease with PDZ domain
MSQAVYKFALGLLLLAPAFQILADEHAAFRISIDAQDLPRKLLNATLVLPLEPQSSASQLALWYPKWVPGSHGPGGPIANIGGLQIESKDGEILRWNRTPGEVYRIVVDVPPDVSELTLRVRYIANQPTPNSMGHDVFGSKQVGMISPGAVLFYPEGTDIDTARISTELQLPEGWKVSSAMPLASEKPDASHVRFLPTTLRTYVDSPMMVGRYRKIYSLNEDSPGTTPPHRLHVFSDVESTIELPNETIERLTSMVSQASNLMGSHPFDQFDVLLALTDQLPANGLEHLRSSFNVLPQQSLASIQQLKGWNRLLIPHEYMHAWCGKFRRPAGMVTSDFHTPKGTELLWVYEGLTQYLGELIEARCGLMSHDEFRHRLGVELRLATHQQGRRWRSLADTGAESHMLRSGSPSWPRLRGSQDYYMEGMLLWLEIDAQLRVLSDGKVSLDDFCKRFFKAETPVYAPQAFDRQEIVDLLGELVNYDWDGLIHRRVDSPLESYDSSVALLLGYRLEVQATGPKIPASTFRFNAALDEFDSIGCTFSRDGMVTDVLLGSPADQAKLGPGVKVVGVNRKTWSSRALRDAISGTSSGETIELLLDSESELVTVSIPYAGGNRYLNLVRDDQQPDLLETILSAPE